MNTLLRPEKGWVTKIPGSTAVIREIGDREFTGIDLNMWRDRARQMGLATRVVSRYRGSPAGGWVPGHYHDLYIQGERSEVAQFVDSFKQQVDDGDYDSIDITKKGYKAGEKLWEIYANGKFLTSEWAKTKQEAEEIGRISVNDPSVTIEAKNPKGESKKTKSLQSTGFTDKLLKASQAVEDAWGDLDDLTDSGQYTEAESKQIRDLEKNLYEARTALLRARQTSRQVKSRSKTLLRPEKGWDA